MLEFLVNVYGFKENKHHTKRKLTGMELGNMV